MDEKIQKLVAAANSTNEVAKSIGQKQLAEMGLDKDGNPLKKEEPKAKKAPAKKSTGFKVGDVVYNKKFNTVGIVRIAEEQGEVKTDADGNVDANTLQLYNPEKYAKHKSAKIAPSTKQEIKEKGLAKISSIGDNAKPEVKKEPQYDCDDLLAKEKERKKKAKAAAEKRANAPKKTPATKNKEAVEKTAARVEKNVEVRAKKGDVTVAEIDKLISEYEEAIKKLKELREKASGMMAKGGSLSAEETSKILERARGVHKHHCNCGDKMRDGGNIEDDTLYDVVGKKAGQLVTISEEPMSNEDCKRWIKEQGIEKYYQNVDIVPYRGSKKRYVLPKFKNGGAVNSYSKWESDVTESVAEILDISVGDAQGIVESNSFKMAQSWSKGLSAKKTAEAISKA